jgi:hypothetical protein
MTTMTRLRKLIAEEDRAALLPLIVQPWLYH